MEGVQFLMPSFHTRDLYLPNHLQETLSKHKWSIEACGPQVLDDYEKAALEARVKHNSLELLGHFTLNLEERYKAEAIQGIEPYLVELNITDQEKIRKVMQSAPTRFSYWIRSNSY